MRRDLTEYTKNLQKCKLFTYYKLQFPGDDDIHNSDNPGTTKWEPFDFYETS